MTGFRGSDESLDREIAAIERMARVRVRRVASELTELERDLRELKRERARRRATAIESSTGETPVRETA
jgi:sugar-specific transcriptional regulator TrmB